MGFLNKKAMAGLALASSLALGGCYGDGYGYGGVGVGYGGYGDGYYGGGPYGYAGYPAYGWNDGFYYPGAGYYVYDRAGGRQRWNDGQRRYWEGRRGEARVRPGDGRWRDRGGPGAGDRPDRPRDGGWRGRADRADAARPGLAPGNPDGWTRPDRAVRGGTEQARAGRGQGVWGAFPGAGRAQGTPGGRGGRGGNRP